MKKLLLCMALISNCVFAADDTLKCPDDYDKIFMSFNVSNSKTIGFGSVYYCVLKGVLDTESGIKSIVKTIKTENKLNGDVTPLFFKVIKE